MKTVVIGMLDEDGYEMYNRVYDSEGLSPNIRTYQGGNLQPKVVMIKQATKDGYIPCNIGGSGSKLCYIKNKERQSNAERRDKSNDNNGEYP